LGREALDEQYQAGDNYMAIATEELKGGIFKVVLEGRLDIEGAAAVDSQMRDIAASRKAVLVDLQKVSFLGSVGLRALVIPARAIKGRGGKMVLYGPNEMVEKVLKMSGADALVPVHHELQSALTALQES
jgi:anti-anti-sigma factor